MPSFTDLNASEGFKMTGLGVLGAGCALARRNVRVVIVASLMGLLCVLSAAAPPEKPIPKALPVADDEPATRTKRSAANRGGRISGAKDAAETPLGRYYRQVTGQVEKKWSIYLHVRREGLAAGYLQLVFYVNKKGKVEGLRVIDDKKSNKVLTEITLQAIKDAEIPPMPADVYPLLPNDDPERLKIQYDALIY